MRKSYRLSENNLPEEYLADLAQLGERTTEDRKVPGSIPGVGRVFISFVEKCLFAFLEANASCKHFLKPLSLLTQP